jgi:ABC-type multidrug transport system fused ATPase/permease subunit
MTERILYATMAWFEATPSGRLINRFSQDISTIDTGVMSRLQVRVNMRRGGGGRHEESGRFGEET